MDIYVNYDRAIIIGIGLIIVGLFAVWVDRSSGRDKK